MPFCTICLWFGRMIGINVVNGFLTYFIKCSFTYKLWLQGEPSFHLFGFIMCVGATAARALKSVLQGILLSSEGY